MPLSHGTLPPLRSGPLHPFWYAPAALAAPAAPAARLPPSLSVRPRSSTQLPPSPQLRSARSLCPSLYWYASAAPSAPAAPLRSRHTPRRSAPLHPAPLHSADFLTSPPQDVAHGPVMALVKASESTAAHGLTERSVTSYSSKVTLEISLL